MGKQTRVESRKYSENTENYIPRMDMETQKPWLGILHIETVSYEG